MPARPGAALCGTGAFPFPSHFPLRVAAVAAAAYVTETAPAPLTNPFRMGRKFFNVSHASNMSRRGSDLVCRLITVSYTHLTLPTNREV